MNQENQINQKAMNDLAKGTTIEVPYKMFGQPMGLWIMLRRSVLPGIPMSKVRIGGKRETNVAGGVEASHFVVTKESTESARLCSNKLVQVLNGFTDRPSFNATGLVKDGQAPSDDVYNEWTKSIRFMVTVVNGETVNSPKKITLGVIHKDPWKGLVVEELTSIYLDYFMSEDGVYCFNPTLEPSDYNSKEYEGVAHIDVGLYHLFTNAANLSTGNVPALYSPAAMRGFLTGSLDSFKQKLIDGGFVPDSKIFYEIKDSFEQYLNWSGETQSTEFNIAVLKQPYIHYSEHPDTGEPVKEGIAYKFPINVSAKGEYQYNAYFEMKFKPNLEAI